MRDWGCHTCGRMDEAPFTWLARRRSIAHEHRDHGFSVYEPGGRVNRTGLILGLVGSVYCGLLAVWCAIHLSVVGTLLYSAFGASFGYRAIEARRLRTPLPAVPRPVPTPQDATPAQWAARQPQDKKVCTHPETVEDIQLCSTHRWVHCLTCGELLE